MLSIAATLHKLAAVTKNTEGAGKLALQNNPVHHSQEFEHMTPGIPLDKE